jgi:stage II sporulation protein M
MEAVCIMHLFRVWRRNLNGYMERQGAAILMLGALFVIGVIFGALAIRSLQARDRLEVVSYLSKAVSGLTTPQEGASLLLLKRSLWGHLKLLALYWVLGISLVGALGAMVITFLRGVVTGFVVAFLAAEIGLPGVALALGAHLPHSLIEVPAILLAGGASVTFSGQVIRSWIARRRVPNFYPALAGYSGSLLLIGLLFAAASLVEAFLTPLLVRAAAPLFIGS